MARFYKAVLRESTDPFKNSNGGDYDEYIVIAVNTKGRIVAGSYRTSYEDGCCSCCGSYSNDCNCYPEIPWVTISELVFEEIEDRFGLNRSWFRQYVNYGGGGFHPVV